MNMESMLRNECPKPAVLPCMVYTVEQHSVYDHYSADEALRAGTLFPQLFKPMDNRELPIPKCPMEDHQAKSFAMWELRLYLDTHPNDYNAWKLLRMIDRHTSEPCYATTFLRKPLWNGGEDDDLTETECKRWHFSWVDEPWPWELAANAENCMGGERHVCV